MTVQLCYRYVCDLCGTVQGEGLWIDQALGVRPTWAKRPAGWLDTMSDTGPTLLCNDCRSEKGL